MTELSPVLPIHEQFTDDDLSSVLHLLDEMDDHSTEDDHELKTLLQDTTELQLPAPQSANTNTNSNNSTDRNTSKRRRVSQPPLTASRSTNSNRARDERKQELIYLRRRAQQLEQQLHEMKQQPEGERRQRLRPVSAPAGSSWVASAVRASSWSATHGAYVWQDLASRQFEARERSERENIRLKLLLEGQMKVARKLQADLNKRTTTRILKSEEGQAERRRKKHLHEMGDEKTEVKIFKALLDDTDHALSRVEAVFGPDGCQRLSASRRGVQVRQEGPTGSMMDIFGSKVMPFSLEPVAEATWQHFADCLTNIPERYSYNHQSFRRTSDLAAKVLEQCEHKDLAADIIIERFGLELRHNQMTCDFDVRQTFRKHVDNDKVVIAWRCYSSPFNFSHGVADGITLQERGYSLLQRIHATPHDYTLVQTCFIIQPEINNDSFHGMHGGEQGGREVDEKSVRLLTDLVANSVTSTISWSHQLVENYLLDKTIEDPQKSANV